MKILIILSIAALWLLVVFQGLVLLEMLRQMSQIRRRLDLDDRPIPISLGQLVGKPLPRPARAVWSENGAHRDGALLLLSADCTTCRLVASGLQGVLSRFEHQRIVTILQTRSHTEAVEMLAEAGLASDEVVLDLESEYGAAFGIDLRPAAVVIRDGIVSEAAVVRNPRQLRQLLEMLESTTKEVNALDGSVVATPS